MVVAVRVVVIMAVIMVVRVIMAMAVSDVGRDSNRLKDSCDFVEVDF